MAVDWGQIAQVGMNMASQYASSRAAARGQAQQAQQTNNAQGIAQNQSQNNLLLQMAQIELLRKQMQEQNRGQRASDTGRGDLMANVQDASIGMPGNIPRFGVSGGLRPSALGPNARQAGRELSNQSLTALMQGDSFMPINPAGPVDLDGNMPTESKFDQIMALAGSVGSGIRSYKQGQQLDKQIDQMGGQQPGTPGGVRGGTNMTIEELLQRFGYRG